MPNTQNLRRRIKSIGNTRQITKAMELVSAAKMRRAQELALKSRAYSSASEDALALFVSLGYSHELLKKRKTIKKRLLLTISSDRGLAGSYNSFLIKKAINYVKESAIPTDNITVGKKAQDIMNRLNLPIAATFTNLVPFPTLRDIFPIIKIALDDYKSKKYDSVSIAYTHFDSMVKQTPTIRELLPIHNFVADKQAMQIPDFKLEPNPATVMEEVLPRLIEVQFYQAFMESIASEHSARMMAMKSASDNADDIIDDLKLEYNSIRQSAITQEIAEITAGANALS